MKMAADLMMWRGELFAQANENKLHGYLCLLDFNFDMGQFINML